MRRCSPCQAEAIKLTCVSQNFNDRRARTAQSDCCSSSRSPRLYQASANVGSTRVAARNAASASTFRAEVRRRFPKIERCRRIRWIAFDQNAVEPLGFGNVPSVLSRLRLLKQIIGTVLRAIDRKRELTILISTSPRTLPHPPTPQRPGPTQQGSVRSSSPGALVSIEQRLSDR
jgi:hypothetical protein